MPSYGRSFGNNSEAGYIDQTDPVPGSSRLFLFVPTPDSYQFLRIAHVSVRGVVPLTGGSAAEIDFKPVWYGYTYIGTYPDWSQVFLVIKWKYTVGDWYWDVLTLP